MYLSSGQDVLISEEQDFISCGAKVSDVSKTDVKLIILSLIEFSFWWFAAPGG